MASSDDTDQEDEADKYKNLSRTQLEDECKDRGIRFDMDFSDDDLISLLVKHDKTPDWGKVYAQLMRQYHMDYDSIKERTLPQIRALSKELPEQLALDRLTLPNIFGGVPSATPNKKPDKPPKLSEFMAFASAFDGIR
jgi:hypothetical protein